MVLIGVSMIGGVFMEDVVKEMCVLNEWLIIFLLSNFMLKLECTFE